jgi:hypothetical protein
MNHAMAVRAQNRHVADSNLLEVPVLLCQRVEVVAFNVSSTQLAIDGPEVEAAGLADGAIAPSATAAPRPGHLRRPRSVTDRAVPASAGAPGAGRAPACLADAEFAGVGLGP